jgi:hypothetical protein
MRPRARIARQHRPDEDGEQDDDGDPTEHVFAVCTNTCSLVKT